MYHGFVTCKVRVVIRTQTDLLGYIDLFRTTSAPGTIHEYFEEAMVREVHCPIVARSMCLQDWHSRGIWFDGNLHIDRSYFSIDPNIPLDRESYGRTAAGEVHTIAVVMDGLSEHQSALWASTQADLWAQVCRKQLGLR